MLAQLGRRLGGILFGGSCFLCRGAAAQMLCAPCDASLPRLGSARCPRCALASPNGALCGGCLVRPPSFDATVAALSYRFPADALVTTLKFGGELSLAPLLGGLLAQRLAAGFDEAVDCIAPVPLSAQRLAARGFNQALEIARAARGTARAPIELDAIRRVRDTPAQLGLPVEERRRNLRGAFECPRLLGGLRVAVVDDVMTSGATLEEVAATLKRAGAARVVNWVVARTPPPGPHTSAAN
jgi:ComF family protein